MTFDAIVVGSGQGGKPLAVDLARAGHRTALVERDQVGGTCVNTGCTPTKTMVASARVAYLARRAADYGVEVGDVRVDLPAVVRRKRAIVESFRGGSRKGIDSTENLELIEGEASFTGPGALRVRLNGGGERHLDAPRIFINTGTRVAIPPVPGLDDVAALDNASLMELQELPEHLLVLGGGYIGLEFGQMFRRFGSRVTIVHRGERVLSREDPDVSDAVAEILTADGIDLRLRSSPAAARRRADGAVELDVEGPSGRETVAGTHLLVATGRIPNSDRLGLERVGVRRDSRGYVEVNERLETGIEGIWALGDVKGGPAFTHVAYDDYRILRANLLEDGDATTRGRLLSYAVFLDPQLGRVGMSETEAQASGRTVRVAKMPMAWVARALETDETRGFLKAVIDAETDQILGAAVLGIEGGEIMSVLQVAMMGSVPAAALRDGIFAHPTLAEALNNLFTSGIGLPR